MASLTGSVRPAFRDLDTRVFAVAFGGPIVLLFARMLPDDGAGLGLRLFAAAFCLLVLPGGLIVRAVGWPEVPALALSAAVAVSLGLAFVAFAVTFAVGGTLSLTIGLIAAGALVALVPAARAQPPRSEAFERRMLLGVLVAGLVLGAVAWWVAHSLGTGDVLFHLARVRKIAEADSLSSVNVANEFRDGGLHPGYAFPLWHGILALVSRLAGVDVTQVVLHFGSALVPLAFAATYAAGRSLFGHWAGGVATLAAQVAQIGFSRGGTGTYQSIALPSSLARGLLVPLVLALLFAYLRSRDLRAAAPARMRGARARRDPPDVPRARRRPARRVRDRLARVRGAAPADRGVARPGAARGRDPRRALPRLGWARRSPTRPPIVRARTRPRGPSLITATSSRPSATTTGRPRTPSPGAAPSSSRRSCSCRWPRSACGGAGVPWRWAARC